jgi:hypothetical protein
MKMPLVFQAAESAGELSEPLAVRQLSEFGND